jgi:hypothetical protein
MAEGAALQNAVPLTAWRTRISRARAARDIYHLLNTIHFLCLGR